MRACFFHTMLYLAILLLLTSGARAQGEMDAAQPAVEVPIYVFFSTSCPHCAKALSFLNRFAEREPRMRLVPFVLAGDSRHESLFADLSVTHKIDPPAVPLIIVGEAVFVGYGEDDTSGAQIEDVVKSCLLKACSDPIAALLVHHGLSNVAASSPPARPASIVKRPPLPESVTIPVLGEIKLDTLSLPTLTVLLGGIDGFNPCAMWVLVFLIGLLMGLQDPFRMWAYGAVFLFTSAAVYFAFLAAWLNVFLFLGALTWIRITVGALALGAGAWYLAEFWRNPEAVCKVTSPGSRQRIMDRMRAAVSERSFMVAALSIVMLAVAVNLIELLCSAGIPAVYTQVLALSDLSPEAYYGYLLLYIVVFMLDDALVFVVAMMTLTQTGLAGTYARYSHLIGGIVLLIVGSLLVLRPDLLAFK